MSSNGFDLGSFLFPKPVAIQQTQRRLGALLRQINPSADVTNNHSPIKTITKVTSSYSPFRYHDYMNRKQQSVVLYSEENLNSFIKRVALSYMAENLYNNGK